MKCLDREQAAGFVQRFKKLDDNSVRIWGKLEHSELIPHLIGAFRYSMGEMNVDAPFRGNWFTTKVLPHIIFTGCFLPPKNVKTINKSGEELTAVSVEGDVSDLETVLEEFISKVESGKLKTPLHMIFGDIGPEGWSKFHVIHLRHHLKQFNL